MKSARRAGAQIAMAVLAVALLATGVTSAAGGRPSGLDPSFGVGGRDVVSLPVAFGEGSFGPIAATPDGHLLVSFVAHSDERANSGSIGKLGPDGAPDPTFGKGGWVKVGAGATVLAADPAGGVLYVEGATLRRLQPDGARDRAFDARAAHAAAYLELSRIGFDATGRIIVSGTDPVGPHFRARDGEAGLMRFAADGTPDRSFGSKGVLYLGREAAAATFAVLPDGSMLVGGTTLKHLAADGAVLPGPELPGGLLAGFPDGSFALGRTVKGGGCTVSRYDASGTLIPGFAQGGVFSDPRFPECEPFATPGGGLLVRGVQGTETRGVLELNGPSQLLLLTPAGAPDPRFAGGAPVNISAAAEAAEGAPWEFGGLAITPGGGIVVAGGSDEIAIGGDKAVLLGLTEDGSANPSFGSGGTVVERAHFASWTRPASVAAEPNGELIVTGVTDSGATEERPFWMRLDADGKLLRTSSGAPFTTPKLVATNLLPAGGDFLYSLTGGDDSLLHKRQAELAKLRRDGSPARAFGRGGVLGLPRWLSVSSYVVDPDGGVTVLGATGKGLRMAAYRLTPTGQPDRSFGHGGLATVKVGGTEDARALGGVFRPGGNLVVAGAGDEGLVVELGPSGHPVRGHGGSGILRCACGGGRPGDVSAVFHRGRIYLLDRLNGHVDLVGLDAKGRLDRSFAGRGYRRVPIGSPSGLYLVRGRLIVVGQRQSYFQGPSRVLAFDLDGRADRSFRPGATLTAGEFVGSGRIAAAAQPDGRLVVAGEGVGGTEANPRPLELLGLR